MRILRCALYDIFQVFIALNKVIPHLKNWEEILYITQPEEWSAAAVYQVSQKIKRVFDWKS